MHDKTCPLCSGLREPENPLNEGSHQPLERYHFVHGFMSLHPPNLQVEDLEACSPEVTPELKTHSLKTLYNSQHSPQDEVLFSQMLIMCRREALL